MFFEVRPEQTVVEIWPGGQGGWHRSIMEPLFSSGFGTYIPVLDAAAFPAPVAEVADGDAIFRMLKPGGIFGIADHRGNESVPQDPRAVDGYVKQSHVVMLAERAGFELVDQAEINANSQGHETQS